MDMGEHAKRRFYLLPSDYDAELVECGCELFMNVRPGFIEVVPSRFLIDRFVVYSLLKGSKSEKKMVYQKLEYFIVFEGSLIILNYLKLKLSNKKTLIKNSNFIKNLIFSQYYL